MHYYSCGRAAKFEHDGAHYCKTHHPPNVKAKRIAKHAKLISAIEQECQAYKSADDELAAMRKNAARYLKVRRGQHWSVIDGIGDTLRGEELDSSVDAINDAEMANAVA